MDHQARPLRTRSTKPAVFQRCVALLQLVAVMKPVSVRQDAVPPVKLRSLVENAIQRHLPEHHFQVLKQVERSDRAYLQKLAEAFARHPE